MSDDKIKQIKALVREILVLCEDIPDEIRKKETPENSPKKEFNPQNTASGVSWSFMGNQVLFSVPFKFKDGFKDLVAKITKHNKPLRWNKELKVWTMSDEYATNELFEELRIALFEENKEEHIL